MWLRTLISTIMFTPLILSLPHNLALGQEAQVKTERFLAGHIDVPPGFKTERVIGPDFNIDYVIREGARVSNADMILGIYTGSFPGFSPPARNVKTTADSFSGHSLKWYIWRTQVKNKKVYHYEALIRLEGGQWVWHIFIVAPDMQRMRELLSILKSYQAK